MGDTGPDTGPGTDVEAEVDAFRERLLAAGVLGATAVPGVYHRSGLFEALVRGVEALAHAAGQEVGDFGTVLYASPVMPRTEFVRSDYLRSFPDLTGSVHSFTGGDREHAELLRLLDDGDDWTTALVPAEVTLCAAACHSLYATLPREAPEGGRGAEIQGTCFRHEPSPDPARMQSFRMHEFVRVGTPAEAVSHRDEWLRRGTELLAGLALPVETVVANDPFFGRAGRLLARNQRAEELKYEIVCPVSARSRPTAIASANYHLDHFGGPFELVDRGGATAHSACFGFGLDRIALALLATHGTDPDAWPTGVRQQVLG